MKKNCESCGQLFTPLDDDVSDKKYCPKCQDPERRELRKILNPNYKDPDPNFEKRVKVFQLWKRDSFFEGKFFNPNLLADEINQKITFRTDLETGLLYNYNASLGVYDTNSEALISHIVKLVMKTDYTPADQKKVFESIKASNYTELKFSDKMISFKNMCYNPKENKTIPFYDKIIAEKEPMVIYSIPVKYDPKQEVPKEFIEFLDSSLDPEEKLLIQELMGYCLLPDYMFHHLFWIFGVARAGKGVWARTMKALFGRTNSSVPINHLNGHYRFAEARLHRKLCNICSEPTLKKDQKGQTRYMSVQTLDSLTGKDLITAELKNVQNPIEFYNCAKMIVISNELPRVRETSDAFLHRLKIIHFNKQFLGKNQIKNYEDQWINDPEKMSGILNLAIAGSVRLLENGDFIIPESEKELKIQYARSNDTYNAFMEEKTVSHYQAWTPKKELFEYYSRFCNENELFCLSEKDFNQKMRYSPKYREEHKRFGSKRVRGWRGVELKKENQKDVGIQKFLEKDKLQMIQKDHEKNKVAQVVPLEHPSIPTLSSLSLLVNTPVFPVPPVPKVVELKNPVPSVPKSDKTKKLDPNSDNVVFFESSVSDTVCSKCSDNSSEVLLYYPEEKTVGINVCIDCFDDLRDSEEYEFRLRGKNV